MDARETRHSLTIIANSPEDTRLVGVLVGQLARPGHTVLLSGPLGAGKTLFVQGVADGLGVREAVRSPTFALVNEYHSGRLPLYHVDLYRLANSDEVATVGVEEYLERHDGVIAVEWPERAPGLWPEEALHVRLEPLSDAESRLITLQAAGAAHRALLEELRDRLAAHTVVSADASGQGGKGAAGH